MAGVASVMVAPEDRGRGVGRRLMAAMLDEMAGARLPVVGAVPGDDAAVPVAGLGNGGRARHRRDPGAVPARPGAARSHDPGRGPGRRGRVRARLRRAAPGDAEAVVAVIGGVHQAARDCGPITWDVASVAGSAGRPGPVRLPVRRRIPQLPVAQRQRRRLFVEGAEAISAAAQRAFWAHVGSHASIADQVYARVGPADPFWWLTREPDARRAPPLDVDAPRGRRPGRHRRARLPGRRIPRRAAGHHRRRPAGQPGRWALTVTDGKGALHPLTPPAARADPPLTLGPRGLAALYAGTPVGHTAPGRPGRRRLARGRRGPGHGVRRDRLHARLLLKANSRNTPPRCATGPPRAGRFVANRCSWTSRAGRSTSWA